MSKGSNFGRKIEQRRRDRGWEIEVSATSMFQGLNGG
jgi:hypothetical protein